MYRQKAASVVCRVDKHDKTKQDSNNN